MSQKKKLAYARVIDKIRLPEKHHKVRKLTSAQKEEIRQLYQEGEWTYRKLADEFCVSYGTIQCAVNPQAYQQMLEAGRRYRETHEKKKVDSMELRRRKKHLILKGEIKL